MELDNVLKLIDAGFTADEIRAYAGSQDEPASQDDPASQDEPASQASMSADIIDALNAQFERLTKVIQAGNINTMSHGGQKAENIDDVMNSIINRGGSNGR